MNNQSDKIAISISIFYFACFLAASAFNYILTWKEVKNVFNPYTL